VGLVAENTGVCLIFSILKYSTLPSLLPSHSFDFPSLSLGYTWMDVLSFLYIIIPVRVVWDDVNRMSQHISAARVRPELGGHNYAFHITSPLQSEGQARVLRLEAAGISQSLGPAHLRRSAINTSFCDSEPCDRPARPSGPSDACVHTSRQSVIACTYVEIVMDVAT